MWRDFQSDGSVDRKVLNFPVAFAGEFFKKQITFTARFVSWVCIQQEIT